MSKTNAVSKFSEFINVIKLRLSLKPKTVYWDTLIVWSRDKEVGAGERGVWRIKMITIKNIHTKCFISIRFYFQTSFSTSFVESPFEYQILDQTLLGAFDVKSVSSSVIVYSKA